MSNFLNDSNSKSNEQKSISNLQVSSKINEQDLSSNSQSNQVNLEGKRTNEERRKEENVKQRKKRLNEPQLEKPSTSLSKSHSIVSYCNLYFLLFYYFHSHKLLLMNLLLLWILSIMNWDSGSSCQVQSKFVPPIVLSFLCEILTVNWHCTCFDWY